MDTNTRRTRWVTPGTSATAVLLAVALAGCGAGDETPPPDGTPTSTGTSADASTPGNGATGAAVEIPDTRAGQAAQWVLDQLAADDGPGPEEAREHFAEPFLAQVPAAQVAGVFAQMRATGPFVVTGYSGTEDSGQAELTGAGEQRYLLHVSTTADGRMQGLFLQAPTPVPEVDELADLDDALASLDAETSVLVADVDDGVCTPVLERDADELRPIGSAFKLYVLGAVHQAVVDGALAWDDTLTLTEDVRSLPSGVLQEEPAGTEVSVQEAARGMIAISDNTATDLLMDALGRERVEAAVTHLGHDAPEVMRPFPTTREMFQVAFTDPELRRSWEEAGTDPVAARPAREAILAELPGGEITIDESLMARPAWPVGLDWFASARDLCAAHVTLDELAGTGAGEPLRAILSANPGVEVGPGWDHVAFKGGSAPGEMTGSWYAVADDGERYVVVVQIAAERVADVPDAGWMAGVVGQTLEVLNEGER